MRLTILLPLSLFISSCSTLPEKIAEPPKFLSRPTPTYPVSSRHTGEEGRVILKAKALANGSVGDASIQTSSSFPQLDMAALECLKDVRFVPAKTTHGNFVDSWVLIPITFKIND